MFKIGCIESIQVIAERFNFYSRTAHIRQEVTPNIDSSF